jgi:uncharacterized membrane protein YphA (DoxX/SURF4 family)
MARTGRVGNILAWILSTLLALGFIMAGTMKFIGQPEFNQKFRDWGYSDNFRYLIGGIELAGGVLLMLPLTAFFAAVSLAIIMIGALYTVQTHLEQGDNPVPAAISLALLLVVAYLRRPGSVTNPATR